MISMSEDHEGRRPGDDVTLRELRSEFPDLHISTDFYGRYRAWVARGQHGHPWLVMSTDTERFRAALRHPLPR